MNMNATTSSTTARVAVVTSASRGAGKGIALARGAAGRTVYVTGRSRQEGDSALLGSVHVWLGVLHAWRGQRPHGVAVICLWMVLLRTERTERALQEPEKARKYASSVSHMESPQFPAASSPRC